MLLWNWLMPSLFGIASLSFLQALGVLALVRLLTGNLGHWHHPHSHRYDERHHTSRWRNMTEEERKMVLRRHRLLFGKEWAERWQEKLNREANNEN